MQQGKAWNAPRTPILVDPQAQQLATQEEIARRRAMAQALAQRSDDNDVIRHPLQGIAKMADAGIAGFMNAKADSDEKARQQAYSQAILGMMPEGGLPGMNQEALARAVAIDPRLGEMIVARQLEQSMAGPPDPVNVAPGNRLVDPRSGREIYAAPPDIPQPLPDDVEAQKIRLAQAGRAQNNTTINNSGNNEMHKLVAQAYNTAQDAALDAQKREPLYASMEAAIQGFTPGASAEMRAMASNVLKEWGIGEGMPEAEVYKGVQRRLELAATPKGQGQITENERALIRDTIPAMTMTPEAIGQTLQLLRALDAYDFKVAQIFRDNARQNGGIPDPVTVREQVAALGPPLPGATIQQLQMMRQQQQSAPQPAPGGAPAAPAGPVDFRDFFRTP